MDLLFYNDVRKYTFISTKDSEFLVLSKKHFKNLFLIDFKDIGTEFIRHAYSRKKRTRETYREALEFCKNNFDELNNIEQKNQNTKVENEKGEINEKNVKRNYKL